MGWKDRPDIVARLPPGRGRNELFVRSQFEFHFTLNFSHSLHQPKISSRRQMASPSTCLSSVIVIPKVEKSLENDEISLRQPTGEASVTPGAASHRVFLPCQRRSLDSSQHQESISNKDHQVFVEPLRSTQVLAYARHHTPSTAIKITNFVQERRPYKYPTPKY